MMELMMMLLGGLVTIFCAYALALAFNVVRYRPFFKPGAAGMPPGSLGLPLLGQTLEFLRCFNGGNPDLFWRKRTGSHFKGLFRTHLFGQPTICVITPEPAKSVLMNDKQFGVGWPKSFTKLLGGKSFLSMAGESHKRLRRLTVPSLTNSNSLKCMLSDMQTLTNDTLNNWVNRGEVVVLPEILKLTFNIIAKALLSCEPGADVDIFGMEVSLLSLAARSLAINLPGTPYNRALKARRKLNLRLQSIIKERREGVHASNLDVLNTMMQSKDEDGGGLEDEEIMDTILAFMLAGHETTAHAIVWVMYFLHKHPQAWQKLKEEQQIYELKGRTGSLSVSDFKGMDFMSRVIDETLRIVNLSPFTFRKALEDVELNESTIPKGWSVQLWFRAIHLDPATFPDPYTFNPDRWIDCKPKLGAYVPFGAGARGCPGSDFAKLQISALMHHMILSYRWEPINPQAKIKYLPHPRPRDGYAVRFFKNE
ncbi:hypothetical protein O6H91_15G053500 [Diphasiastrum complanatum]|uniref:Uncharacterized protein n=3 Tax=Diphasiastrum complanatum TaxID=34168 RepID=A0ACC2BID2_DIPCM|nr:hypothetical protein O6H91_15G052800 [Diphasiastrum complanatum]KAJ7529491.1 hypothetical protein O6H91_15G053100 [Diphasiastrum complanatum]KAJ7529499.1 hypothetical protein O6H91_15G053500 [Diphasiastrum complanatum]